MSRSEAVRRARRAAWALTALGLFALVPGSLARADTVSPARKAIVKVAEADEQRRPKSSWWSRVKASRAARVEAARAEAARQDRSASAREVGLRPTIEVDPASADRLPAHRSSLWTRIKQRRAAKAAAAEAETVVIGLNHDGASTALIEPAAAKVKTKAEALGAETDEPAEGDEFATVEVYDPLEPVNRAIFGINMAIDFAVLRPVSFVYRTVVPSPVRVGVSNALHNFSTPVIIANDLMQGKPGLAGKAFLRFMINSTAGLGGFADVAAGGGLERHSEDFGQTLAVWGAGPGPYLVVPILGPSTMRDGAGLVVDTLIDPSTWLMWELALQERLAPTMAYTVSGHEEVMDEIAAVRKTSPDFYASLRDIYMQKRASEIADGVGSLEPLPADSNR